MPGAWGLAKAPKSPKEKSRCLNLLILRSSTQSPTSRPSSVFFQIFDLTFEMWYRMKSFTDITDLRVAEKYKGFDNVAAGLSDNISEVRLVSGEHCKEEKTIENLRVGGEGLRERV
ncbi:hypothetical protein ACFX11_025197 [Malus domestica]